MRILVIIDVGDLELPVLRISLSLRVGLAYFRVSTPIVLLPHHQ